MKFTKMQGIGNDYIYINCFEEAVSEPERLAAVISDRHFGVGGDGLILICPSEIADCRMRMFNADGSEGEMCGNGIRCVGKYVYDRGIARKNPLTVETGAGIKTLYFELEDGLVSRVRVNMGVPSMAGFLQLSAEEREFETADISMGNPHGVVFLEEEIKDYPVQRYGKILEKDASFPQGANIEFVRILNQGEINMRVWERGSGETLACGTGACAGVVAGILAGKLGSRVIVHLPGGDLEISWEGGDEPVYLNGEAEFVFEGEWQEHKSAL